MLPGAVLSCERRVTPAAVAARVAGRAGDSTFLRLEARVSGDSPGRREGGTDRALESARKEASAALSQLLEVPVYVTPSDVKAGFGFAAIPTQVYHTLFATRWTRTYIHPTGWEALIHGRRDSTGELVGSSFARP